MIVLASLFEITLRAALAATPALLLASLICLAFKPLPGPWRCWILRLAFAKLFLALFWITPIELRWLPASAPRGALPLSSTPPAAPFTLPEISGVAASPSSPPAPFRPRAWVAALWFVGCVIGLALIVKQWFAARALRRGARPLLDDALRSLAAELAQIYRLANPPILAASPRCQTPLLVGLRTPVLIIPENITDPAARRLIIAHEFAHLARRDLAWNWLPVLAQTLFFFHPLVWLARREYMLAQEIACDQLAIRTASVQPARYAQTLVDIVSRSRSSLDGPFAAAIVASHKTLKRRIRAMKLTESKKYLRPAAIASLATVLAACLPFRIVAQNPADPAEPLALERPATESAAPGATSSVVAPRNAARSASLSARRPGVVEKIFFREGDSVKKGDLLVQLDVRDVEASLETARARFRLAEATFGLAVAEHRQAIDQLAIKHKMAKVGRISTDDLPSESLIEAQFTRAQAEFELAKRQLRESELELAFHQIHAPWDGIITKLHTEEGESVIPSIDKPLLILGSRDAKNENAQFIEDQIHLLEQKMSELAKVYTTGSARMDTMQAQLDYFRRQRDNLESPQNSSNQPGDRRNGQTSPEHAQPIASLELQLALLQQKDAQLAKRYRSKHPAVVELRQQIASIQEQINARQQP